MDINKLKCAFLASWNEDTCFPGCKSKWNDKNIELGQCAVTALVIQDYLGGEIKVCRAENTELTHYYNEVLSESIDFTFGQFSKDIKLIDHKYKAREEILRTEHTKNRYEILKKRVKEFLEKVEKIEKEIYECNKCGEMIEKFEHSATIHYGKDNKIVMVGEAPANNGWRRSGKLWYGIDGKITGSGRVMQKLLDELDLKLEDITFVEGIKCYPLNRKSLYKCKENCYMYLLRQLELLNPNLIIPLGDTATKCVLPNIKYKKFAEVAGREHKINRNNKDFKVFPIFHPSPISPNSYKGNVLLFEIIKDLIESE